jgi:hypothetical protein
MEMTLIAITFISMLIAVVMSAVAWRTIRRERQRSEARVAALAAAISGSSASVASDDLPLGGAPADLPLRGRHAAAGELFAASPTRTPRSRLGTVIAAGALIVGTGAALVIVLSGVPANHSRSAAASTAGVQRPAAPRALELVSLTHERDADRLTVRGIVRNPPNAVPVHGVIAVVFLFDSDGGFVASARAAVDRADLEPGSEGTFAVTIPAEDVGRYRVSFRIDDQVLPHVDARKL